MATEKIRFGGHAESELDARLDRPDGPVRATALFAHCFTCSKSIPAARRIASRLAAEGIAVLRFDFTGLGHSEGEFANTDFTSNVDDLICAARHLEKMGLAPDLLIGHSLGGAAVLKAAAEIPSARAVVTIGAPADPAHVAANFQDRIAEIEEKGEAEVSLGGRPFRVRREFLDDIRSAELRPALENLRKALLTLHAPRDAVVGIDNASEIFTAAKHPKSFITLDGADHLISNKRDAEYAAEVIAAWASRYLDLPPASEPAKDAPEAGVRVIEADRDGFKQDVLAGRHHILADEPEDYGGTDLGLSPYQFLAAGLGACTSMTIRLYARRKDWPLDHVRVDVTHDKVHASDCEEADASDSKVDCFRRRIALTGELSDEQRARLMEIADKCPVHRTLMNDIRIETTGAD